MSDINKVWLSGLAVTQPVFTKLNQKTPLTYFTLQVNERFTDRDGNQQVRPNLVRIECLGKAAEITAEKVRQGQRYTVDGYVRQDVFDGKELVRVRTFAVYPDESADAISFQDGIRQALKVLKTSRDIEAASERLEALLVKE